MCYRNVHLLLFAVSRQTNWNIVGLFFVTQRPGAEDYLHIRSGALLL